MAQPVPIAQVLLGIRQLVAPDGSKYPGLQVLELGPGLTVRDAPEDSVLPRRLVVELGAIVSGSGWQAVSNRIVPAGSGPERAPDYSAHINEIVRVDARTGNVIVLLPEIKAANKGGRIGLTFDPPLPVHDLVLQTADGAAVNGAALTLPSPGYVLASSTYSAAVLVSNGVDNWIAESLSKV